MHWLLLRGLAREQRHWGAFPKLLEGVRAGDTVHTLDLPGAGTERDRLAPLTVGALADDVRARWLALQRANPGPWGLLGVSLGGMVSLAWVGAYPDDFERVVIVNSSAGDLSKPWHRMSVGVFAGVVRSIGQRDAVSREQRVLAMTTTLPRAERDALAREWAGYTVDRPMQRPNVARQILAAMRFRSPAEIRVPMLVLSGAGDELTHPSCPRAIAKRYGARIEVHPSAGHDLGTDAGEWMAERIHAWIARG